MTAILETVLSDSFSWKKTSHIHSISPMAIPKDSRLVKIMAWRRIGDMPLPESVVANTVRIVCVTSCQCVKNDKHGWHFIVHCYGLVLVTSSNGGIFRVTGPSWGEFTGEFPSQRPVRWSFDVFFDPRLNKRLSKPSRRRWFETPSRSLWRHCNAVKQPWK